MCGIAGVYDSDDRNDVHARRGIVTALNRLQSHRGPDAQGLWSSPDGRCVLGHKRLSIIDLDPRSTQPMQDDSARFVLTYNGEIYNYLELRAELEAAGEQFHTTSDTEVLLHAYRRWGRACFARLDGMFAIGLFDRVTSELVLARDRAGEKPLFVARQRNRVAFASEFKALISLPGLPLHVSPESLMEYLVLRYIPAPNTLYEEVSVVQPGTYQIYRPNGEWKECSYDAFELEPPSARMSEADCLDETRASLIAAVRTRLLADVPLGAFLSSGIDSSLVCAIAAIELGADLRCFGAGFAGSVEDETEGARQIANELGLPFESYQVSEQDLTGVVNDFGRCLDEPNGDRSCVPTFFLSGLVRRNVTVALSGDGGDELFGGYSRYMGGQFDKVQSGRALAAARRYFTKGLPVFDWSKLLRAFPDLETSIDRRIGSHTIATFSRPDLDTVERLRVVDFHTYLPGAVLAKVDRMSMRHALEVRTPFFSPALLRISSRLPRALSVVGREQKVVLRRLLTQYLPPSLIRKGKQGFGMPASFFQTHSNLFAELAMRADEILREWEPMRGRAGAFDIIREAARDNINSLWAWIALGQWVASVQLDGAGGSAAPAQHSTLPLIHS